jgi:hypothetical protein
VDADESMGVALDAKRTAHAVIRADAALMPSVTPAVDADLGAERRRSPRELAREAGAHHGVLQCQRRRLAVREALVRQSRLERRLERGQQLGRHIPRCQRRRSSSLHDGASSGRQARVVFVMVHAGGTPLVRSGKAPDQLRQ